MNNTLHLDGRDPLAREVLASQMGNACDGERTKALASQWEEENGRALVLPWEEPEDLRDPFSDSYYARKKKYDQRRQTKKASLVLPPDTALFELRRLRAMPYRDQQDKKNKGRMARRINELEEALGLPITDYSADEPPKQDEGLQAKVDALYEDFARKQHDVRAAEVGAADYNLAMKVFYADPDERVKSAALKRMNDLLAKAG